MTDLRSAAQQALEAMKSENHYGDLSKAIAVLEAALEQPEQAEPVADRAAFERHAKSLGYSVDPDTRAGRDGGYWSSHTHLMWETWQAALKEKNHD